MEKLVNERRRAFFVYSLSFIVFALFMAAIALCSALSSSL